MGEIWVENEFAPLSTVVVAQSELSAPKGAQDDPDMSFLPDADLTFTGDLREARPEHQRAWEAERDAFIAVLERHGIRVLRPRQLNEPEKQASGDRGYANFFARDPFFTIGNHVIEGSLRFRHRRGEVLPMRDVFREEVYPSNVHYVAVPSPEAADPEDRSLDPGPFLEGGDVLVLGRHVLVGSSGLATNQAGYEWLRKYLGHFGYRVELVRLHEKILHLDCALGLIRDGLAVVCPEAFIDPLPSILSSWDRVEVSLEDASRLATNGLPLSPDVYVTDPRFEGLGREIAKRGVEIEYVDFSITRSFGGSFRCSTQPLLRR